MKFKTVIAIGAAMLAPAVQAQPASVDPAPADWPRYARDLSGTRYSPQVAFHEGDAGTFHGDIRSRSHGNAHMGERERRRIVNPISGHRDCFAFETKLLDFCRLLLRKHFGFHLVDA